MDIETVIKETHKHFMTEDYEYQDGDEIFTIDGYLIICQAGTSNIVACSYDKHEETLKNDVLEIWNKLIELKKYYIRIHPYSRWKILFQMFPHFKTYYVENEYIYLKIYYGDENE